MFVKDCRFIKRNVRSGRNIACITIAKTNDIEAKLTIIKEMFCITYSL
jgi:hypothetical protein